MIQFSCYVVPCLIPYIYNHVHTPFPFCNTQSVILLWIFLKKRISFHKNIDCKLICSIFSNIKNDPSIKKNHSFFDLDNSSHTYTLVYSYMCSYLKGPGIGDIVGYNGPVIAAPYCVTAGLHITCTNSTPQSVVFSRWHCSSRLLERFEALGSTVRKKKPPSQPGDLWVTGARSWITSTGTPRYRSHIENGCWLPSGWRGT